MDLKTCTGICVSLLVGCLPSVGHAQWPPEVHPALISKYSLTYGLFHPDRSFKIGVDATIPVVEPRDIDLSQRLQLSNSETTQSAEIGWRFADRWLLRGQVFEVGSSRSATLEEDVAWGDYVFQEGTGVSGGIDVSIVRLFVGRKHRWNDKFELGFGGGLHRLDIEAYLAGQAILGDNPPISTQQKVSTHGPLPNVGAWYTYAFSPRWAIVTRLDWLSASIDKYDGTIVNAAIGLNLAAFKRVSFGLSYNFFEIDVTVTDDNWKGRAEQRIHGPFVYFNLHL